MDDKNCQSTLCSDKNCQDTKFIHMWPVKPSYMWLAKPVILQSVYQKNKSVCDDKYCLSTYSAKSVYDDKNCQSTQCVHMWPAMKLCYM